MNKDARFTERSLEIQVENIIHEGRSEPSQPPETRHVSSKPSSEHANMTETTPSSVLLPCKRKLLCADETPKCSRRIPTVKRAALRTVCMDQPIHPTTNSKGLCNTKQMDVDPFVKRTFRDADDNYYNRPLEPLYPELAQKTTEKSNQDAPNQVFALPDNMTSSEVSLLPYPDLIQEVSKCPLKPDISVTFSLDGSTVSSLSPYTSCSHPSQSTRGNESWFRPENANVENGHGAFKITSYFKKPKEQTCKLTMQIKSSELDTVVAECGPKGVTKTSHKRLGHEDIENSRVNLKRLKTSKPVGVENSTLLANLSDVMAEKSVVNAAPSKPRMFTGLQVNK